MNNTNGLTNQKSEFSHIMKANHYAAKLSEIAFRIKLTSLNALLLVLRSENEKLQGYIVVTEELIRYSDSVQKFAASLQSGIFKKVEGLSTQLKSEVLSKLLCKTAKKKLENNIAKHRQIVSGIREFSENSNQFIMRIRVIHQELLRAISRNEQFVAQGKMLSMHAKIESSNSRQYRESFNHVATDLTSLTDGLKTTLVELQKVLHLNIASIERKRNNGECAA